MKLRKVHLLYLFSIIPAIIYISVQATIIFDALDFARLVRLNDPSMQIISGSVLSQRNNFLSRQLFLIAFYYYGFLVALSAAWLIWRLFVTRSKLLNLCMHVLISISFGSFLVTISFSLITIISSFFGVDLFGPL